MDAAARFRAWMGAERLNQTTAAERLGCSQSAVSRLWNEATDAPDMELAVAIERETKDSPLGQILVSAWVTAADSKKVQRNSGARKAARA